MICYINKSAYGELPEVLASYTMLSNTAMQSVTALAK